MTIPPRRAKKNAGNAYATGGLMNGNIYATDARPSLNDHQWRRRSWSRYSWPQPSSRTFTRLSRRQGHTNATHLLRCGEEGQKKKVNNQMEHQPSCEQPQSGVKRSVTCVRSGSSSGAGAGKVWGSSTSGPGGSHQTPNVEFREYVKSLTDPLYRGCEEFVRGAADTDGTAGAKR